MAANDLAEEISAMSDDEVAESIRAEGGDPEAIGERGAALVAELLAKHGGPQPDWKANASARRGAAEESARHAPKVERPLPSRAELLRRVEAARKDTRYAAQIAAAFRSRSKKESSDEELAALLDEIARLRAIAEAEPGGGARNETTAKTKPKPKPKTKPQAKPLTKKK